MGKLKLYNTSIPRETIIEERESVIQVVPLSSVFFGVLQLNCISVTMNGGKPLKFPQGKGLVIRKPAT